MDTSDPSKLPLRMTTTEVCELARVSKRTFQKRRASGLYQIQPCDRGAENLWARADVVRLFGLDQNEPTGAADAPKPTMKVDADALREARSRRLRRRPTAAQRKSQ